MGPGSGKVKAPTFLRNVGHPEPPATRQRVRLARTVKRVVPASQLQSVSEAKASCFSRILFTGLKAGAPTCWPCSHLRARLVRTR